MIFNFAFSVIENKIQFETRFIIIVITLWIGLKQPPLTQCIRSAWSRLGAASVGACTLPFHVANVQHIYFQTVYLLQSVLASFSDCCKSSEILFLILPLHGDSTTSINDESLKIRKILDIIFKNCHSNLTDYTIFLQACTQETK